jgi:hypothetical protein
MAEQWTSADSGGPFLTFNIAGGASVGRGMETVPSFAWVRAMAAAEQEISGNISRRLNASADFREFLAEGEYSVRCQLTFSAGSLNWVGTVGVFGRPNRTFDQLAEAGTRRVKSFADHLSNVVSDAVTSDIVDFARHVERSDRLLGSHPLSYATTQSTPDQQSIGFRQILPPQTPATMPNMMPSHINIHHHERELPGLMVAIERLTLQMDRFIDATSKQSERLVEEALRRYKRERRKDLMLKWLIAGLLLFGCLTFAALLVGRQWHPF